MKGLITVISGFFKRSDEMKYLFAGLGNIGDEYEDTRHNIGFKIADSLAEKFGTSFQVARLGSVATIRYKGRTIILLKPSTYMNLSGKAVRYWMNKEKILQSNVLVLVDDINLSFGRQRLREKGSDGGHNGLRDIVDHLGSNYSRLRVGIGKEFYPGEQANYVLGKWSADELKDLPVILGKAVDASLSFATIGVKRTMDQFNN